MGSRRPSSWLSHSILQASSPFKCFERFRKLFCQLRKRYSTSERDQHASSEGVRGTFSIQSRLLQQNVCSSESYRGISSNHRFINLEPFHSEDSVSHGDNFFSNEGNQSRGLDDVPGSQGCLFPDPRSSRQQEIPSVCVGTAYTPVQGSMFRTVHCPSSLHQGHGSSCSNTTQKGSSSAEIPGRLVSSRLHRRGGFEVETKTFGALCSTQHNNQLGEVRSHSQTDEDISGNGDSLKRRH